LYITCSVCSKENEKIAEYIQQSFGLKLVKMKIIEGHMLKADTMFAALLQKRS
jgi:16S rRNA C967 or C1407 C5-methylase (RsmB/RsmF family)